MKPPVAPLPALRLALRSALLAALVMTGCKDSNGPDRNPDEVLAVIGPAGGTLVSKDGLLTLTVPEGALASAETLSIALLDTAQLGPEFAEIPATVAYDLGPDGLAFQTPVALSFTSSELAVTTDTSVTMKLGSLLTSAAGELQGLDSVRVELRQDTIVLTAQLSHFSPLVVTFYGTPITATVVGVPDEVTVRSLFTVAVRVEVPADLSEGDLTAQFQDLSGPGIAPVSIPTQVNQEIPRVTPTAFQDSYTYTCTTEGAGIFLVRFWVSSTDFFPSLVEGETEATAKGVGCSLPKLTVTRSGDGVGRVTSDPVGIACADDCTEPYPHGSIVTLTAEPILLPSKFAEWSGDCSGTNPSTTVLMDKDRTCNAKFDDVALFPLSVTTSGTGNGTVTSSPTGIECGSVCTKFYFEFTLVTLTATAATGSAFAGWSGDCDADGKVVMSAAKACTARFNLIGFGLTLTKWGNGTGTVSSSPAGIVCASDCLESYAEFTELTEVTLTATPDPGSAFTGWLGECTAEGKVIMNAARACAARFGHLPVITSIQPNTYTAGGGDFELIVEGAFFVEGSGTLEPGSTVFMDYSPDPEDNRVYTTWVSDKELRAWVSGTEVATAGTRQITVVTPGVGTSEPVTLTVENPLPVITELSRTSAEVGDATFQMTVTGSGFVAGSTARWNGGYYQAATVALATTVVSATSLTVTIDASLLNYPGNAVIAVVNPAPGGGTSNELPFPVVNPVPSISLLSPTTAEAGGPAFTLEVTGAKFAEGAFVTFAGTQVPTTWLSRNTAQAAVPAALIAAPGTVLVTVTNRAPGGGTSNQLPFEVVNPVPVITSIEPGTYTAGSADLTLTVNGDHFVDGQSKVYITTTELATTFVSIQRLTATVPAAEVATAGTRQITVQTPGGGTSAPVTLTVENPLPVITELSRTLAEVGDATFQMTVTGSGFVAGSTARWNGGYYQAATVALATTVVSATSLTVTIDASLLNYATTALITVVNPAPGGGTSNVLPFNVVNPVPSLSLLSPTTAEAGGPAFTLEVTGAKFAEGAFVTFAGTQVPTTWLSRNTVQAAVPAALIAAPGAVLVTVTNPAPGGGSSNALEFQITPPPGDPCTTLAPLDYGVLLEGTLAPGDCETGSGITFAYLDLFDVTVGQVSSALQFTADPSGYVLLVDGDLPLDAADVALDPVFSFVNSPNGRLVFLPLGPYLALVSTPTGEPPEAAYALSFGAAANPSIGNCNEAFARPGVTLGSQTLIGTDCAGFNRYDADAGATRYDHLWLSLAVGETATIEMSSTEFDPVITVIQFDQMGNTIVTRDDNSGGGTSARLTLTGAADARYRVEFTSTGSNRGTYLGGYSASIQRP